jgi:hypothetical protein
MTKKVKRIVDTVFGTNMPKGVKILGFDESTGMAIVATTPKAEFPRFRPDYPKRGR